MLYFDERGVSRKYDVSIDGDVIHVQRTSPDFSQRMALSVDEGGRTARFAGEMSRDGGEWEPDLELAYSRVE
jgi:hypothetical protein